MRVREGGGGREGKIRLGTPARFPGPCGMPFVGNYTVRPWQRSYRVPFDGSRSCVSVLHATAAESKGSQSAQEGSVARSRSLSSRPLPLAIFFSVTFYTQRLRNPFMLRGTRDRAQISRAAT